MFLIRSVKEANGEYAKGKTCGPDELPIVAIHAKWNTSQNV